MSIFTRLHGELVTVIEGLQTEGALPAGLPVDRISVEAPRDPTHGDLATNAAMVLAKPAGQKPRDLAEMLAAKLEALPYVAKTDVAGPGFLNITLGNEIWHDTLRDILAAGESYGVSDIGGGERVNVEYVSANPTGPLHIGHARGTVFGDVLSALLAKAGYDVTKEYYINDAGSQVDTLARSAHLRYREALGEDIGEIPSGLYPGDYMIPVGEALAAEHGNKWKDAPEDEWLAEIRAFAIDRMMDMIRDDLAVIGVEQDVYFSERSLVEANKVEETRAFLDGQGLMYTGVLEPPKGKTPDDWEPRPQELFKATQFGDDVDRAIRKSDGSWTYFASDIAYHKDKFERGFKTMIDVWGADHGGYVKRMKAATKAISADTAELDVKICQIVKLLDKGEPVKMSKRAGTFVTLRDLVDEVGKDVVRFIMLTRSNDAPLDFDLSAVVDQSRENPVFYVQMAHARCCSVMRLVKESFPNFDTNPAMLRAADISKLTDEAELALAKHMAAWQKNIEAAAKAHEPHRIAYYLYELASTFHGLWTKGREKPELRFIIDDDLELTTARMAMVSAVRTVIASGLKVLGVTPVEELR